MTGLPIKYQNDELTDVIDILNYNDVCSEDTELLRQALIFGKSFEINYIDEESEQRFRVLDTRSCIPVYYNNLNNDLAYVIRFWKEDLVNNNQESYMVEVYGADSTRVYRSTLGFTSFALLEEKPNFYNQVPVTVFSLNKDEEPIFQQIVSLQDSYNSLYSGAIDDFDAFADAYLVLKGAVADEAELDSMKQHRVLMLDSDAAADYLTKNINDTALQNILTIANNHIHTISNCPDFTDKDFMSQSGVAIKYKLIGFENTASAIEQEMRKALQKRIELISSILNKVSGEAMWRDINIVFTRNLPISLDPSNPAELMQYKGLVSDETLLGQVPFVKDVNKELELVNKQKLANMELYMNGGEDDELLGQQRSIDKESSSN